VTNEKVSANLLLSRVVSEVRLPVWSETLVSLLAANSCFNFDALKLIHRICH
jgi:hypothetical protein